MSVSVELQILIGFLGLALIFMPLERFFAYHRQPLWRTGWTTDTIHYIVGCFLGKLTDALSLFVAFRLFRQFLSPDWITIVAAQPAWLQFIELVLVSDFFAYIAHRLLHTVPWLWRLHTIHHSADRMDWLINVRLHPLDKIIGDCFQFIPVLFLGFSEPVFFAYTIFLGLHGFLNHSNIKVNIGLLRWIIATPEFHHWHHCKDRKAIDRNFAPHTLIFDWLFGTVYFPSDQKPKDYGLSEPMPKGYFGQLFYPFRQQSNK